MAPAAGEPGGDADALREERLLHLLRIGRDCVDVQLVRRFVRLRHEEDAQAFLAAHRRICTASAKTGLVKRSDATPAPRTAVEEHEDLAALARIIDAAMDIFVGNGNAHVSYWRVAEVVDWGNPAFDCLRSHFTLPRLLAGFSLFDHHFQKKTCALSMRNFAVWGAERCVKDKLLHWQGGRAAVPLASETLSEEEACSDMPPKGGEFLSLVEVARQLRWTSTFAPHVGDFLEWAWRCPSLELGVRVSDAAFAQKDAQLESRDLSERSALKALVRRLAPRPGLSEHIASCRQALGWRDYGLGPLEKFLKKYSAWFEMQGELVLLRQERAASVGAEGVEGEAPPTGAAAAAPPASGLHAPIGEVDAQDGDGDSDDLEEPLGAEQDEAEPLALEQGEGRPRLACPRLFHRWDGAPYDEACLGLALKAPGSSLRGAATALELPLCSEERLASLGAEVAAFAQAQSLAASGEDGPSRQRICQEVEATLRSCPALAADFPGLRVRAFGTSASGLGQRGSDLDLLLELDGRGNAGVRRGQVAELLEAAGAALQARADFADLQLVPRARVPLLRGVLDGVRVDLTVGSRCGLWNTALLRRAAAQEPGIVIPLCVTVAIWSKGVSINDSPNGLLSTYSLMLLVIFYLQIAGVLPAPDLSDIAETAEVDAGTVPAFDGGRASHAALGRLLLGFFFQLASFRWDAWVASVRCGAPLPREEKPKAWQVQPLCVEDPFETHLNTCRRVNPRGQRQVLAAAGAALRAGLAGAGLSKLLGGRAAAAAAAPTSAAAAGPKAAARGGACAPLAA